MRGPIGFILKASGSRILLLSMFAFCVANYAVLAFLPVAIDWAENVGSLIAIERYPQGSDLAITLAVFFHQARLALLPIVLGCLLLTLALRVCLRCQRRTERRRGQIRSRPGLAGETS